MKKNNWLIFLLSLLLQTSLFAESCPLSPCLTLDKVQFQVASKLWVNTQLPLLSVNVNMTLSNTDLVQARADIMARLNQIAKGEWHITQFDRSQDSSGLEKLYVEAEARVTQASLNDIYKNAKTVSKPGTVFSISSVEFKPNLQEVQTAKSQLRERLYQMVSEELTRLNKVYASQNYTVANIYFFDGEAPSSMPSPMQGYGTMNKVRLAASAVPAPAPELNISNILTMSAIVEAASTRKGS